MTMNRQGSATCGLDRACEDGVTDCLSRRRCCKLVESKKALLGASRESPWRQRPNGMGFHSLKKEKATSYEIA